MFDIVTLIILHELRKFEIRKMILIVLTVNVENLNY
jgi:hypothetical protein